MHPYAVLFISLVLDLLGFTLILPLIPSILDYYALHDKSGLYSYLEQYIVQFAKWIDSPAAFNKVLFGGLLGAWFSFLQFLVSPFIGAISDVFGRKKALLVCLVGVSGSYLMWCLSKESFLLFCLSRTIGGLSKGNVSLSTAIVADVSTEQKRGRGMALIGIAFSVGFIVGPVLGAMFAACSKARGSTTSEAFFFLPALFALSLAVANVIFVAIFFKESLPLENRAQSLDSGVRKALDYVNPVALFSFRSVSNISSKDLIVLRETGWIYFQFLFLYSGLEYTLSFLTHLRFNYTSMQQGKMYLFVGLFMALLQGGFVRRIKPGKEALYAMLGVLFAIPAFVIVGLASQTRELYAGLVLYAFSSAITVPCLTTIASTFGPPDQKGTVMGIFRSIGALARALGPFVASAIFWKSGSTFCYLAGALLLVFPLVYVINLRRRLRLTQHVNKAE